jgi:hypothetical protein
LLLSDTRRRRFTLPQSGRYLDPIWHFLRVKSWAV